MRDDNFSTWLENYITRYGTPLESRPRSDAMSRCRRVEEFKGDLDLHFYRDEMRSLVEEFTYSRDDESNNIPPPILINGDPVTGTASLKYAIKLYLKFCIAIPPNIQNPPENPDEILVVIRNRRVENTQAPETHETIQGAETIPEESELHEQHFIISEGETGHTYESIIGPYLNKAITITVQEPYIREYYQIHNFVRFCETVVRLSSIQKISLITKFDDSTQQQDVLNKLSGFQQSLRDKNIGLDIKIKPYVHDREIRIDTQDGDRCSGWVIIIGRALDFYQRPDDRFGIGVNDFSLRPCRETSVVILHA
jgi:hypothetical protein